MTDRRVHLDVLTVNDPCTEDWGAMRGDEVKRFCRLCHQNVYNLSSMDRATAERFVAGAEGDVCVRFYRRADGTVVTRDCAPDRFRAARRAARSSLAFVGLGVAGVLGMVGALGFTSLHVAGTWVEELARKVEAEGEPEPIPMMGAAMPEYHPEEEAPAPEPVETPELPSQDGAGS